LVTSVQAQQFSLSTSIQKALSSPLRVKLEKGSRRVPKEPTASSKNENTARNTATRRSLSSTSSASYDTTSCGDWDTWSSFTAYVVWNPNYALDTYAKDILLDNFASNFGVTRNSTDCSGYAGTPSGAGTSIVMCKEVNTEVSPPPPLPHHHHRLAVVALVCTCVICVCYFFLF
jgi:hypothetical protein